MWIIEFLVKLILSQYYDKLYQQNKVYVFYSNWLDVMSNKLWLTPAAHAGSLLYLTHYSRLVFANECFCVVQ